MGYDAACRTPDAGWLWWAEAKLRKEDASREGRVTRRRSGNSTPLARALRV